MDVSIIIPVYNASAYLKKCFESILKETIENLEVIVINDGSTDDSINIIREYQSKFKNMIVIDKIHEGQARARNRALRIARGEYVLYLDADDWLTEGGLTKLYQLAKEKDADIANGLCYIQYEDNTSELDAEFPVDDVQRKFILNEANLVSKLVRRDYIIKHSLYFLEDHIFEDVATIPAYGIYTNKIIYESIPLYNKLDRKSSVKNSDVYDEKLEDIFDSLKCLQTLFDNAGASDNFHDELEYIFIDYLLHDASLRFRKFKGYEYNLDRVNKVMDIKYPNWENNKYFLQKDKKYQSICKALYKGKNLRLKWLLRK